MDNKEGGSATEDVIMSMILFLHKKFKEIVASLQNNNGEGGGGGTGGTGGTGGNGETNGEGGSDERKNGNDITIKNPPNVTIFEEEVEVPDREVETIYARYWIPPIIAAVMISIGTVLLFFHQKKKRQLEKAPWDKFLEDQEILYHDHSSSSNDDRSQVVGSPKPIMCSAVNVSGKDIGISPSFEKYKRSFKDLKLNRNTSPNTVKTAKTATTTPSNKSELKYRKLGNDDDDDYEYEYDYDHNRDTTFARNNRTKYLFPVELDDKFEDDYGARMSPSSPPLSLPKVVTSFYQDTSVNDMNIPLSPSHKSRVHTQILPTQFVPSPLSSSSQSPHSSPTPTPSAATGNTKPEEYATVTSSPRKQSTTLSPQYPYDEWKLDVNNDVQYDDVVDL